MWGENTETQHVGRKRLPVLLGLSARCKSKGPVSGAEGEGWTVAMCHTSSHINLCLFSPDVLFTMVAFSSQISDMVAQVFKVLEKKVSGKLLF